MRKRNRLIRPAFVILSMIITLAFMPLISDDFTAHAAGGTVKMTTYNQVIKVKNTVYCAGAKGIYKVKLKNGKVKTKKLIVKAANPLFGAYTYVGHMKKKGGYIYYTHGSEGTLWNFNRVNIKSGKKKHLADTGEQKYYGYVIKNKKIYFDYQDGSDDYEIKANVISMKLNGSSKKRSSVKPKMTVKDSNAKGYSVVIKQKGSYAKDYLKTPKGKFYLGKVKIDEFDY